MALFLDPDEEEDVQAFGRTYPGKRRKTDPNVQDRITENARRQMPQAAGGPMFPPMLGNNGQAFADATMAAHRRENDSRVAQLREMRRLAADQQSEQMKYDYLLRKLEMEREQMEKDRIARRQSETGTYTRTFRNGQWEYI